MLIHCVFSLFRLQEVPSDPSSLVLDYYIRNDPWTKRLLLFLGTKGIAMVKHVSMLELINNRTVSYY